MSTGSLVYETEKTKKQDNHFFAASICAPQKISLETSPLRKPSPGEVRIKLQGCGICSSNIPLWQGREWFEYPVPPGNPGHEGWGIVDAVGEDVSNVRIGQRVSAISFNAFAEYDYASHDAIVILPAELDGKPFPGEPMGCAMNIYRRSKIKAGDTVAIIGIGFLGALLTQVAVCDGARVIAISRKPFSLRVAKNCGADHTIKMDDHYRILDEIKAITSGEGCDCVIEATGAQWPLDLAADIAAEEGRLVIAGYHQDGLRNVNMQTWNWRAFDVVNAHVRNSDAYVRGIQDAVKAVLDGKIDPFPLFTHEFSLEQLDKGLNASIQKPDGYIKGVVKI